MQDLEQLKGKEINMLKLGRGSWARRILLAQALIFIFMWATFCKTSLFFSWGTEQGFILGWRTFLAPGISFQGLIKRDAQLLSDHFSSATWLTKQKDWVIKRWYCNCPQQLSLRAFPIWFQCILRERMGVAVQRWTCVCLQIAAGMCSSLHYTLF